MPANARVLEVVAVAKAERAKAVTRKAYSDEVIAEVTQPTRHLGSGSKAAKAYNTRHADDADFEPLPVDTAWGWYRYWKKFKNNKTNNNRGRKEIVSPAEKEDIHKVFDLLHTLNKARA